MDLITIFVFVLNFYLKIFKLLYYKMVGLVAQSV